MPIGLIGLERKRGKKTLKPFAKAARKLGKAARSSVKLQAGVARGKELEKLRKAVLRKRFGSVVTKKEADIVLAMSFKQLQAAMRSASKAGRRPRRVKAKGRAVPVRGKTYKSAKF